MPDIEVIEVLVPGQPGATGATGDKGDKGETGDVTPAALAAVASAEDAAAEAEAFAAAAAIAATTVSAGSWAALAAITPAFVGQRAQVSEVDLGTHTGRTSASPDSDVTGVANPGVYGAHALTAGAWRRDGSISAVGAASEAEAVAGVVSDRFVAPSSLRAALQDRAARVPGDVDRFVVEDDDNNILVEVTAEVINHPDINTIREQAGAGAAVAEVVTTSVGENAAVVVDGGGNILVRITPDTMDHPDVNAIRSAVLAGRGAVAKARDPQWNGIRALAEMLHVISYGQSLSRGHNTIEPVTTTPLDYAYRFIGGARPDDGGSDPAVVYASLVPFIETAVVPYDPAGGLAETPLGGCLRMIAQLLRDEDDVDLVAAGQALLGSAPGAGGKSMAELSDGTPYFARLEDHITYGMTRSGGLGRSYAVSAMLWLQGERDYQIGTTQSAYLAALRQLRLDAQASAQAATGFASPLPLVTYQTATHPRLGVSTPSIALAQLEACGDDYIALASPTYHLPYSATSDVHFDAAGSAWFGAYCGLTLKRWLWDGQKPKALTPLAPMRQGPRIIVPFDVDAGRRLVLDATVGGFANQGFTLVDGSGSALTISSVALSGPAAVQITAAATVPVGARLRYGWAGDGHIGGGNVRDNAGDSLVFDPGGLSKPLHKWAPIFEIEVP
ncbi:hypothetical protein [Xanthobacter sp. 91]|uniref:hypothetical protein n=1 Tax=Xanthobacter sp. 91 TaxID=1117244 RepID=UPI0012DFB6FA|nr:hypothetical protein [Xanthobacter sp. 91]